MASRFRTTEISDPRFESNHLRFITVKTPNLEGRGDICVFVPPVTRVSALPLVTLLHGVYGSAWIWSQKAGVHRTALRLIEQGEIPPMVIAMPSDGLWGDGSGYLSHNALCFDSWIVEDVPAAVIENLPEVDESSPRFMAGLSMGGYGAMRLGAKHGKRYAALSAHSSITELQHMAMFVEEPLSAYAGDAEERELSVLETILNNSATLPALRFDCGAEDPLLEANRNLHTRLQTAGIAHTYQEFPGGHDWDYWEQHIVETLRFFAFRSDPSHRFDS
jgi:enterochelin esterase-like enzyme